MCLFTRKKYVSSVARNLSPSPFSFFFCEEDVSFVALHSFFFKTTRVGDLPIIDKKEDVCSHSFNTAEYDMDATIEYMESYREKEESARCCLYFCVYCLVSP
jgi:hypothetical protein